MKEFYVAKNSLLMGAAMGPGKDFSFRGFPCGQAEAMGTLTVTVSAAADLWEPADIAGLIWFDPSDASARTVISGAVDVLTDKAGGSLTIAAASSTRRPPLVTSHLNGLDMMRLPGTDSIGLIGLVGQITGDCTLVCVCIPDSSQNSVGGILSYQNPNGGSATGQARSIVLRNTGSLYYAWGSNADYNPSGATWAGGTANIVSSRYSGDDVSTSVDGDTFGPETISALTTVPGTYGLQVGRRYATAWDYFKGYVGDIFVVPSSVSDADWLKLREYLANKWSITL